MALKRNAGDSERGRGYARVCASNDRRLYGASLSTETNQGISLVRPENSSDEYTTVGAVDLQKRELSCVAKILINDTPFERSTSCNRY